MARPTFVRAMDPDPREEKLPLWARDTIASLRRRVEDAERAAEEARLAGGPADTDTLLDPHSDTPIRLPKGEHIRFLLAQPSAGRVLMDYVDVRVMRDAAGLPPFVDVMSGDGLRVHPWSSNHVRLTVER